MAKIINIDEYKNNLKKQEKKINHYKISNLKINKINIIKLNDFNYIQKLLERKIDNEDFLKDCLGILLIIKKYSNNYKFLNNSLLAKINNNTNASITIEDKEIKFKFDDKYLIKKGKLVISDDLKYIDYYTKNKNTLSFINNRNTLKNIITKENNIILDSLDNEIYFKESITNNNYEIDKINNKHSLIPTKIDENTKVIKEYTKIDNKVLYKYQKIYLNKNYEFRNGEFIFDKNLINKEEYYIADNYLLNSKKIPKNLYFMETDYSIYNELNEKNKSLYKK